MLVDLYKNRNTASKTYGQFYGRVFNRETLSLKGFAKHMMEHGKRITYEELVLTLQQMVSCLKELAIQGVPVKMDGLGTFYPSIESTGSATVLGYDPLVNIRNQRDRHLILGKNQKPVPPIPGIDSISRWSVRG